MDGWQTYILEAQGGLVTNLSPLQQGINQPGSARILVNFEPSIDGGYRRIEGFAKYDDNYVPPYGDPVVQGSGQTGTTLILANIFSSPKNGDTFTVDGVTGTYTVSGTPTFDAAANTATLTITPTLDSSPADKASVTFGNTSDLIIGCEYFNSTVIAARNNDLYKSTGTGWTKINVPSYGTVLVNGGSQTGTTLAVDGIASDTYVPQAGDTFSIAGVEKVYTVVTAPTVTSGAASITITPALDSSPADNVAITFLSSRLDDSTKYRFRVYNFDGTEKLYAVNGVSKPMYYNGSTFYVLQNAPSDIVGAAYITEFADHIFFAKDNSVSFLAPLSDNNVNVSAGAGTITFDGDVTGIIPFRDQLIVFTTDSIHRLVGNTVASFQMRDITKRMGCNFPDTIQEFGSDIIFLSKDGLRMLGGTDQIGDVSLAAITRSVQGDFQTFQNNSVSFSSVVIQSKSQYRIFGYNTATAIDSSRGYVCAQFSMQGPTGLAFSELKGFKAYVSSSRTVDAIEYIYFANTTGFVYEMESGNSFDGEDIEYNCSFPYINLGDPTIRKSYYKITVFTDPQGSVDFDFNLNFDFNNKGIIQPQGITFTNTATTIARYGTAIYGTSSLFSEKLKTIFESQLIGSSFVVSFVISGKDSNAPFSIDAMVLQYATHDRR